MSFHKWWFALHMSYHIWHIIKDILCQTTPDIWPTTYMCHSTANCLERTTNWQNHIDLCFFPGFTKKPLCLWNGASSKRDCKRISSKWKTELSKKERNNATGSFCKERNILCNYKSWWGQRFCAFHYCADRGSSPLDDSLHLNIP